MKRARAALKFVVPEVVSTVVKTAVSTGLRRLAVGAVVTAAAAGGTVLVTSSNSVPTTTMYDSVTVSTIPRDAVAAAGYTSGLFPTWPVLVKSFPHAHLISIAINAGHFADCLDVEPGDAVPSQVVAWIRGDIAAGFKKPCVYSSLDEYVNQIIPLIKQAGIPLSSIEKWDAHYTFVDHIDPGFDATQWTDRCLGRNLDCSRVTLDFLSAASVNPVVPKPAGPSDAVILRWQHQRNSGFGFYRSNRCTAPQSHPQPYCSHFAAQVVTYQRKLWKVPRPGYGHWSCFGPHARTHSLVCWIARPEANWYSHGRAVTQRAYSLDGCDGPVGFPRPVRSRHCNTLRQRIHWFDQKATAVVRAFS